MAIRLNAEDHGFAAAFDAFARRSREGGEDARGVVAGIISRVRSEGFPAVADLTSGYDRFVLDEASARVSQEAMAEALETLDPDLVRALRLAADRIKRFHDRQMPDDHLETDDEGLTTGWRWTPVDAAGLYVPGGRAAYPSSVLMNAIPAKAAGVGRLVMCSPTPGGVDNPVVLAAASIAGVDEVWRIGGAQAIAALAYGAGPVAPVDVIVGPGNAYVAEAKRQVFGVVGIDAIAGPSEIVVVADSSASPDWIASDLLSQAEHDPSSSAVLFSDDESLADAVDAAVSAQLAEYPRRAIAEAAWNENSAIILLARLADAPPLVDRLAPEHLELAVADPQALLSRVRHAGAIFLGRHTPEALGDYLAGPNHVLPTSGAARYASGLSTLTFMKRTTIIGADAAAIRRVGPAAELLAEAEGLPGHALSIRFRLGE